jgi:hypothetical protein
VRTTYTQFQRRYMYTTKQRRLDQHLQQKNTRWCRCHRFHRHSTCTKPTSINDGHTEMCYVQAAQLYIYCARRRWSTHVNSSRAMLNTKGSSCPYELAIDRTAGRTLSPPRQAPYRLLYILTKSSIGFSQRAGCLPTTSLTPATGGAVTSLSRTPSSPAA